MHAPAGCWCALGLTCVLTCCCVCVLEIHACSWRYLQVLASIPSTLVSNLGVQPKSGSQWVLSRVTKALYTHTCTLTRDLGVVGGRAEQGCTKGAMAAPPTLGHCSRTLLPAAPTALGWEILLVANLVCSKKRLGTTDLAFAEVGCCLRKLMSVRTS